MLLNRAIVFGLFLACLGGCAAPTPTSPPLPTATRQAVAPPTPTDEPTPTATRQTVAPPTPTDEPTTTASRQQIVQPTPPPAFDPVPGITATPTNVPLLVVTPELPAPVVQLLLVVGELRTDIPPYDDGEWAYWVDDDDDCQNVRDELLIEKSQTPVRFATDSECQVTSGRWLAPYTGEVVTDASSLEINHTVPLANAHASGGWAWASDAKQRFANDLAYAGHLTVATALAVRSKGVSGPEEWRPPEGSYWCEYAEGWARIKSTYQLMVSESEWAALTEMLVTCVDSTIALVKVLAPGPDLPEPTPTVDIGSFIQSLTPVP